jgi:hypothetical protein
MERRPMMVTHLPMALFMKSTREMSDKSLAHAVSGMAPSNGLDALLKPLMGR